MSDDEKSTPEENVEDSLLFWMCKNCVFVVIGSPDDAHLHHQTRDCWTHWLFEFRSTLPHEISGYIPTGREIHTSDAGGYYLKHDYSPEQVYDAFARVSIIRRIREFNQKLRQNSDTIA